MGCRIEYPRRVSWRVQYITHGRPQLWAVRTAAGVEHPHSGGISINLSGLKIGWAFAGLLTIIMIGLLVENVIFRTIQNRTVRRWGMQT